MAPQTLLALILAAAAATATRAFLLPGTYPSSFAVGAQVPVLALSARSARDVLPYRYGVLPVCQSTDSFAANARKAKDPLLEGEPLANTQSMGQYLTGEAVEIAPFAVFMGVDADSIVACNASTMSEETMEGNLRASLQKRFIAEDYRVNVQMGGMPATTFDIANSNAHPRAAPRLGVPIGFSSPEPRGAADIAQSPSQDGHADSNSTVAYFLYNHWRIEVLVHEVRSGVVDITGSFANTVLGTANTTKTTDLSSDLADVAAEYGTAFGTRVINFREPTEPPEHLYGGLARGARITLPFLGWADDGALKTDTSRSYMVVGLHVTPCSRGYRIDRMGNSNMTVGLPLPFQHGETEGEDDDDDGQGVDHPHSDGSVHRGALDDNSLFMMGVQDATTCMGIGSDGSPRHPSAADSEIGRGTMQRVESGSPVLYTYDVHFRLSPTPWARRWDVYIRSASTSEEFTHWFALINGIAIVVLLALVIAIIIVRTVRRDLLTHQERAQDIAEDDSRGWKLLASDAFRPPPSARRLCVLLGSGAQLFLSLALLALVALMGAFAPDNGGALLTTLIALHVLSSFFAGYVAVRAWRQLTLGRWDVQRNLPGAGGAAPRIPLLMLSTCAGSVFHAFAFTCLLLLNVALSRGASSARVPPSILLGIIALWACVSLPLGVLGGHVAAGRGAMADVGDNNNGDDDNGTSGVLPSFLCGKPRVPPTRTSQIPRILPHQTPPSAMPRPSAVELIPTRTAHPREAEAQLQAALSAASEGGSCLPPPSTASRGGGSRSPVLSTCASCLACMRVVFHANWRRHAPTLTGLAAGILPFGIAFVELNFVFRTLWAHSAVFTSLWFGVLAFLCTLVVCAEMGVVVVYHVLCSERWDWFWAAWVSGASTGAYFLFYALVYLIDSPLFVSTRPLSAFVYATYSAILACSLCLVMGAAAFYPAYRFVWYLFGNLKAD